MTKRIARPGMPPSPNQAIVLAALREMCNNVTILSAGFRIDTITTHLKVHHLGGITTNLNPRIERQEADGFIPWHASTVRDHLNDLVGKGHVQKTIARGRSYYRTL